MLLVNLEFSTEPSVTHDVIQVGDGLLYEY